MNKPAIPKGTRDFGPQEMQRRNYIFDTIKTVFRKYGYAEIQTPAQELLTTLMGKYGEEGDRLIFRILNSGNFLSDLPDELLKEKKSSETSKYIAEKGLRYDLTVPFARYVVQHRNDITFPFKRFQIQPVWRADKPQKGRYREFYQCDADAIGSESLLLEAELIEMAAEIFRRLGVSVQMHINNRKILAGIAETIGTPNRLIDLTIAMDKLDKVGLDGVIKELQEKDFTSAQLEKFTPFLNCKEETNDQYINRIEGLLSQSEIGHVGVEELREVLHYLPSDLSMQIIFDASLARGLSYYTGTIMEIKAKDVKIGSISGGGRYDNLTGIFGLEGVSGVGISFGADRIYDVLEQQDLFPKELSSTTEILFVNFGTTEAMSLLPIIRTLREKGHNVLLFPNAAKIKKQFAYADALNIPYVAIAGSDEITTKKITLKNMKSGEQKTITYSELFKEFD